MTQEFAQSVIDFDGIKINIIDNNPISVIKAYRDKISKIDDTNIFKQSHDFDYDHIALVLNEGRLSKRQLTAITQLKYTKNNNSRLIEYFRDWGIDDKRIFSAASEYLRFLRRVEDVKRDKKENS